jgi:hypothetical protein
MSVGRYSVRRKRPSLAVRNILHSHRSFIPRSVRAGDIVCFQSTVSMNTYLSDNRDCEYIVTRGFYRAGSRLVSGYGDIVPAQLREAMRFVTPPGMFMFVIYLRDGGVLGEFMRSRR